MTRCRPRALNADQQHLIWFGLTGGYTAHATRNVLLGTAYDCAKLEQLRRMGMLELDYEFRGYRGYRVTEAGADAVGLDLPEI